MLMVEFQLMRSYETLGLGKKILALWSGVYISVHQHRLIGGCSKGHGQGYAELRGIISRHFVGEAPYMLARDESVFTGASATRRIK